MSLKRGLLALGAALAAGILAAVALGQEVVPLQVAATVRVMPDRAGTPSRPQGVLIDVNRKYDTPGAIPPMPLAVDVWFPKGWRYNGAKYPSCTATKLGYGGPSACPRGSIMNTSALAIANPDASSPPKVTVINGGRAKLYFWVVMQNPARVQATVTGTITKASSPRWSYRMHADVPGSLRVVAGIPISLGSFHANVGRKDWITTTNCPHDHRWRYHLRFTFPAGQVLDTGGSVACRAA
jgi:hypothetical protein